MARVNHDARIARAADRYASARFELIDTLRQGREAGMTLRALARACGTFSHEQVRQLLR